MNVKPGYKTTEFWLSTVTALVGILFASDVFPAESDGAKVLGIIASVLATVGYTVSRGIAKK